MAYVWKYGALYDRTRLFDAGIVEKLADELATHRTLAAALSRGHATVATEMPDARGRSRYLPLRMVLRDCFNLKP